MPSLNNPNLSGIQVCKDHSFSFLCLFGGKDVPEPCDESCIILKKIKEWERGRKITISYIWNIIYGSHV